MKKIKFIAMILLFGMYLSCNNDNEMSHYSDNELSQQEQEAQNLDQMFSEIERLANRVPCIAASEWAITGYGYEPCGHYTGYIAYSKNNKAKHFLKKIEEHRNAEREFLFKWGIIYSYCIDLFIPSGVICKNEKPVIEYEYY